MACNVCWRLHAFCLCWSMSKTKSTGAMRRSCLMSWLANSLQRLWMMLKVRRVRSSRRECVWNSRKLGCGPSQVQGTIWHLVLSMLRSLSHSAGASAKIISDASLPCDCGFFNLKFGELCEALFVPVAWHFTLHQLWQTAVLACAVFFTCSLSACCVQDSWTFRRKFAMEGVLFKAAAPAPAARPEQQPQSSTKVRTEFPETWLWSESVAG